MANWSDCFVSLKGDKIKIKKTVKEIMRNTLKDKSKGEYGYLEPLEFLGKKKKKKLKEILTPIDFSCGYEGGTLFMLTNNGEQLSLGIEGRWNGPSLFIVDLVKKYKLSGSYEDKENGCNFFHYIEFEKGKVIKEECFEYFSEGSIKHLGIEYFVEKYDFMAEDIEEDTFKDEYEDQLALFEKYGYPLEKLKQEWL